MLTGPNNPTWLSQVLQSKNLLDWISDLDTKLEVKNVSEHVIAVAKAKNCLVKNIMELADREVDGTPQCLCLLPLDVPIAYDGANDLASPF